MSAPPPRLAVRAVILQEDRLLVVNAFADAANDLWCAPGGGVDPGQSLPDNLAREVFEETGLRIDVGAPCLINEFHNPADRFHQVEVFFRATIRAGRLRDDWRDPEGIVNRRRFVSRDEIARLRYKPDSLPAIAWGPDLLRYDPLEPLVT